MAISTYAELKTALANYLHRSDLTSRIPEFIALAESRINRELRVPAMETSTSNNTVAGTQTIALNSSFLQMIRLYNSSNANQELKYLDNATFWAKSDTATGLPKYFTIEGTNIYLYPTPSSVYAIKSLYYAKFTALSLDADTNWVLTNHPGLILHAALAEAYLYTGDQKVLIEDQAYRNTLDSLHNQARKHKYPAGYIKLRPTVFGV